MAKAAILLLIPAAAFFFPLAREGRYDTTFEVSAWKLWLKQFDEFLEPA